MSLPYWNHFLHISSHFHGDHFIAHFYHFAKHFSDGHFKRGTCVDITASGLLLKFLSPCMPKAVHNIIMTKTEGKKTFKKNCADSKSIKWLLVLTYLSYSVYVCIDQNIFFIFINSGRCCWWMYTHEPCEFVPERYRLRKSMISFCTAVFVVRVNNACKR